MSRAKVCPDLIDNLFLYGATKMIGDIYSKNMRVNFEALHEITKNIRQDLGCSQTTGSTLFLSVDIESEGQKRFIEALSHLPFEHEVVEYWTLYPSSAYFEPERNVFSFGSRMSFILGLLTKHVAPEILILSHNFEIQPAITGLKALRPKARIILACFDDLLDKRWDLNDSNFEYYSLDRHAKELFGVDIGRKRTLSERRPSLNY